MHQENVDTGRQFPNVPDETVGSYPAEVRRPDIRELLAPSGPVPEAVAEHAPATPPPPPPNATQEPRRDPVVVLGVPQHSGPRPPSYLPRPGALPSVGDDVDGAVLPDIVVDGASHGPLVVRAASVRGDSHRYGREPRQDALCVARLGGEDDGLLLLAVADGVGAASRSHVGSNEACRHIAHFLQRSVDDLLCAVRDGDEMRFTALVNSAVGSTAEGLAQMAARREHRPEAYATTLRALLVPVDPTVRNRGFFAVGDGGVARLRDGVWNVDLFDEQAGEMGVIDTKTAALPSGRYAETRIFRAAAPGDVLVLCTDGLSTPLAGDAGMREFLGDAWGTGMAPEPADFLWQVQFRVKSYDDDRTAICLWDGAA